MDRWTQDLRYAARGLLARPGFTLTAMLTLALGIGATTAIFGVVHTVVLRPLPYEDVEQVVRIAPDNLFFTGRREVAYFRETSRAFADVAGWGRGLYLLTGDGEPEEVRGARVTTNHFDMLGVRPLLGRAFTDEETTEANAAVAVLSHDLWTRRFGSDPGLIGRTILMGGNPFTVVGVLGPAHQPIEHDWEIWTPVIMDPDHWHDDMAMAMNARLAPGVSLDDARSETVSLFRGSAETFGFAVDDGWLADVRVIPIREWILGDDAGRLLLLLGAVAFVLLIACVNVANLLLARGHGRSREIGIRIALGAGRRRVVRQLLVESALLGILGGLLGTGLALGLFGSIGAVLPASIPRAGASPAVPAVLGFALLLSLGSALVFGLLPALRVSAPDVRAVLAGERGTSSGPRGHRTTHLLVAVEVALAVVLLAGSGLTLRSLQTLVSEDPGFRTEGVVTFRPRPSSARHGSPEAMAQYFDDITAAIRRLPDVEAVGAILFLPMTSGGAWGGWSRPGSPAPEVEPQAAFRRVTPDYFTAMGVPLVRGRGFTDDDRSDAPPVVILNEHLAREAFGAEDPIGQMFQTGFGESPMQVVGVVADVRQTSLAAPSHPELYVPFAQSPGTRRAFAVRVTGDPASRIPAIQQAVWSVDDETPLLGVATMEDVVRGTTANPRFFAALMTGFATLALALGCIGVYGVTTYLVGLERRAMGVRIAMGAPSARLVRHTVVRGMAPVLLGAAAGLVLAAVLGSAMRSTLYGIQPLDPPTFFGSAVVLVVAALLALYGPARRASRTNPVEVLRDG